MITDDALRQHVYRFSSKVPPTGLIQGRDRVGSCGSAHSRSSPTVARRARCVVT